MLYYEGPHTFTRAELETARAIANHLASVIARFSALASLEETIRYNELFAGVLAHDLRTPLSAILNAAQLLLLRQEGQSHSQASQARPLGKIIASGMRMGNMITQLLDFTKARSGGGIQLDLREIDLGNVAAHAIGELELAHPEWTVRCEMAGDMKGSWDHDRLVQVLSNLIANAGQHGRKGEPVTARLDGQRAEEVLIEVHNGGAVSPSVLPTLFDPFRTTRHHRGQSSGLGLGLFIVREIVKAHGGTVSLDSSEAAGTTVTLRLPRRAQRDRLPAAVVL
jgi:signal transduction histidine kinase